MLFNDIHIVNLVSAQKFECASSAPLGSEPFQLGSEPFQLGSAQLGSTQLDSAQEISAGTHNYYLPNLFCLVALQECLHFWAES